jgi:ubiquinone/menaquinone biosynthesis C-methylase UbiE
MVSDADICGDGALLPFKDNSVDYLVARHNFEHYEDPRSVLKEWGRVVKPDGIVGIVLPDDCFGHSRKLDPTH